MHELWCGEGWGSRWRVLEIGELSEPLGFRVTMDAAAVGTE